MYNINIMNICGEDYDTYDCVCIWLDKCVFFGGLLNIVLVCFSFPNPKSPFWNYKYNIGIWLSIKSNFLEKFVFWVCEKNAHSQNGVVRSILQKLLCVDESIHWVIGSVTKLPPLLLKTLALPLDKSTILLFKNKKIPWFYFNCYRLLLLQHDSSSAVTASSLIFFFLNIFLSILSFRWRRRTIFWVRKKTWRRE